MSNVLSLVRGLHDCSGLGKEMWTFVSLYNVTFEAATSERLMGEQGGSPILHPECRTCVPGSSSGPPWTAFRLGKRTYLLHRQGSESSWNPKKGSRPVRLYLSVVVYCEQATGRYKQNLRTYRVSFGTGKNV